MVILGNKLKVEVMVEDMFFATLRLPIDIGMIYTYDGDTPVFDYDVIRKRILDKRPSLKNKDFQIYF